MCSPSRPLMLGARLVRLLNVNRMRRLLAITVALLLSACATNQPSERAERTGQDKAPPRSGATAVPRPVMDAAQLKRAANCMFVGDTAAIMYDDFRRAQQTDSAPLQLWKSNLDRMGISVKYLIFAH